MTPLIEKYVNNQSINTLDATQYEQFSLGKEKLGALK